MKSNFSKALTFRSFLISYILVCAVLLGVTGIGYAGSLVSLKQEQERFASLQVRELSQHVANYIERTYQTFDILEAEQEFQEMEQQKGEAGPKEVRKALELKAVMAGMDAKNGLYQNLHVYFPGSNSIVSAETQRWDKEQGITFFCKQYGLEKEEFDRMMRMEDGRYYAVLDGAVIWFFQPVYDGNGDLLAVMFAEYSGERLIGGRGYENVVLLHTQDGQNLLCAGNLTDDAAAGFLSGETGDASQVIRTEIAGRQYVAIGAQMDLFHMELYVLLPENAYLSQTKRACFVLLLEFSFMVLLAALLSWHLSKKMYIPVGNLIQDNHRMSGHILKNDRILNSMSLVRYLEGVDKTFPAAGGDIRKKLASEKGEEYYQLAVIVPQEKENGFWPFVQEKEGEENPAWLVIGEMIEEQVLGTYRGEVLPVGRQYVVILGLNGPEDGEKEYLKAVFEKVSGLFGELFGIPVCIMVGTRENGFDGMKQAYDVLLDGLQYLDFWNPDGERSAGVYMYGDIIENEGSFQFSDYIYGSRKLLNCLESGDFRRANRELDLLFEKTFPKNQKYLKYNLYRMYGLIGILITMLNASADEEEQKFYDSLHYEERLFRIQSMNALVNESHEIFGQMIQYKESNAQEKKPEWLEGMLDFIRAHVADSDLNVSTLADRFQISIQHLSRSFKTWMGMGALEYIHRAKIELAKEMLKNDCSVKNAASAAGYSDMQALTRAFKRYEGITPTQYKEMMLKNEA